MTDTNTEEAGADADGAVDADVDADSGTDVDTHVPPDATAHVCDHCGRPFARETHLALHYGLDHPESLSADDREAFEAARETETARLRRFRLLALAALVALYFGFLFTYAVVT